MKRKKEQEEGNVKKKSKTEKPCSFCNLTTHRSCYDSKCLKYIKVEERPRVSTICKKLKSSLQNKDYLYVIQEAVYENNIIMYRTILLALASITFYLENGLDLPTIDSSFFIQCLQLINDGNATKNKPNEIITQVYQKIFNNEKIKNSGQGQITQNYSISAYMTLLENFNSFAIESHISMYLQAKYCLSKKNSKWLMNVITKNTDFETIPKDISNDIQYWKEVQKHERDLYDSFLPGENTINDFIEYRFFMLSHITKDDQRRFSLLPLLSEKSKFITLDNKCIQDLKTKALKKEKYNDKEKEEVKGYFESLDSFFQRPERKNWDLGSIIHTNGYEIHIQYTTKNYERVGKNKLKMLKMPERTEVDHWDPSYSYHNYQGEEIVAIDPGHHNMFTSYETNGTFKRITKKEFAHRTHRNLHTSKVASLIKKAGLNLNYKSLCTIDFSTIVEGIKERIKQKFQIYKVLSSMAYLKSKFDKKIREQKEIDNILNYLSNKGKKILAFGDCSKLHGFKGNNSGGPVAAIRRYARKKGYKTFLVDESYTSKMMSCCQVSNWKHQKNNKGEKIHGLCICQKCHKTWNRDYNASINILEIAKSIIENRPRPSYLCKNFQLHQEIGSC